MTHPFPPGCVATPTSVAVRATAVRQRCPTVAPTESAVHDNEGLLT